MTLVVDIGNTNIVCGMYDGPDLIWHIRLTTDSSRTADEYYAILSALKQEHFLLGNVSKIALASVVPDMTRVWNHLFKKYFNKEPFIISGLSPIGISFEVSDPSFIGADLIANAFGAWKKYASNCLIIDLGTATTIQLITSNGLFKGAIIAPGIKTASSDLINKTSLLAPVELSSPSSTLGHNTKEAILSGVVLGHALMLDGFVNRIKLEYKSISNIKTIITGGIAELLYPHMKTVDLLDKTLTLDGLYLASKHISDIN